MEKKLITPRKLSGFMELTPEKQLIFDEMVNKIRETFKKNAFMPLDTPVLELSDILLAKSGGEIDKEVYRFKKGDTDICMRYDLTVPLARYVAMNFNTISFPFKRFQFGKAYRGEKAQKGRFREFLQCDADIIGNEQLPVAADAECVSLIHKVFTALNIKILNQISNRNILFGYCEALGYPEQTSQILIILDKINKIGKENSFKSLLELGIQEEDCQKLIDLTLKKGHFDKVLADISPLCKNETYQKGINELNELGQLLTASGINQDEYVLDIGIIRGQNYYTGVVFEAVIPEHLEFGSVCGGGRYDDLAGYFTDKKLPGVGMSLGLTRLFDLLDTNALLPEKAKTLVQLEIIALGDTLKDCFRLDALFKKAGIVCEVNYDAKSFKSKLKDANKREIPYILIVGENEITTGQYSLKNMITGEQKTLSQEEIIKSLS